MIKNAVQLYDFPNRFNTMTHKSVLLNESIDGLELKDSDIFVDGTFGSGGHSEEVAKRFGEKIHIVAIDLDSDALLRGKERLEKLTRNTTYIEGSFKNLDTLLSGVGITKVDKILLDIGLSSNQFEESGRGFSFQRDEPLIMTFKKHPNGNDVTAKEILNHWDRENIEAILKGYGEERYSQWIAKAIDDYRKIKPIETTKELVGIIMDATPTSYHHRKIHPATKTFQALRITVNDEIESLKLGIKKGFELLKPEGRLAVISFHSLEDRIVKQYFKELEDQGLASRMTKKPIVPTEEEIHENPRSRSAKLRITRKI